MGNPVTLDFSKAVPIGESDEQKQANSLRQSVSFGAQQNPDQYANLIKLQKQTGVAPIVAQGNEQDVKTAADVNSLDYSQLVASHPRTVKWASNPDNAAVAGVDEIKRLADMELRASHFQGGGTIRALTPWESFDMNYLLPVRQKLMVFPVTRMGVDAVAGVSGMAGNIASFFGLHGDDATRQNFLQRFESYLSPANADLMVNAKPDTGNALDEVVKNVAPMIPVVMATGGTGLLARTLGLSEKAAKVLAGLTVGGMFTADQGGRTYTEVAGAGAGDYESRLAANRVAAINAPLNFAFGMTDLVPFLKNNPLMTSLALGGAQGATGQFAQNVVTKRPLDENVLQGALQGMAVQGGMHLGMGFFEDMAHLVVAAEQSKLKARSPEKFHEALTELFDGQDSLRIPAEQFDTYFQSKQMDPSVVAQNIGAKNYLEAKVAGGDVEVAKADFLGKLDAEHQKGLLGDVVNPETGMTFNEQAKATEELQKWVESGGPEKLSAETAKVDAETQASDEYQTVKNQLRQQYISTGETPEVADNYATLQANVYSNLARETGMKASELVSLYRPVIRVGAAEAGLNQAAKAPSSISELMDKWEARGVESYISESPRTGIIELSRIVVPKDQRGSGLGTEFMNELTAYADANGKTLTLTPSKDFGASSVSRLKTFYKRFGFVENKGRNADLSISESMIRRPNGTLYQAAFHGSPYKFDQFSLDHLGKGEGNQVYGWGLYFAGDKAVAEHYRRALTPSAYEVEGAPFPRGKSGHAALDTAQEMEQYLSYVKMGHEEMANLLRDRIEKRIEYNKPFYKDGGGSAADDFNALVKYWENHASKATPENIREGRGQLYEADVPNHDVLLDWDKPLREQPPKVQEALQPIIKQWLDNAKNPDPMQATTRKFESMLRDGSATGETIYNAIDFWPDKRSKYLNSVGIPGLRYLDGNSRQVATMKITPPSETVAGDWLVKGDDYNSKGAHFATEAEAKAYLKEQQDKAKHNYVVFDDKAINILKTYYQGDKAQPRGWFRALPDGSFEIGKTKIGDLSTFIHEPAHSYLEILRDLSTDKNASEGLKSDYGKILDFLGAKEGEDLTTDQHEKWARANEQYLREGKAPSQSLKGVFQRFAVWLTSIYKRASDLGVELSPEIRGVFDRMYASEEGVNRAAKESGPQLFSTPEEAGWTPEQFQAYAESKNIEVEQAKSEILSKLNEAAVRERSDAWKEEENNTRAAVTQEIDRKPEYVAIRTLRDGKMADGTPLTLNREALVKQFGEERVKNLQSQHKGLYRKEGGVDAEAAAEILGFNSGEEMMRALETAPKRSQAIETATREFMTAKYGDIRYDGSLPDQARLALENDKRAANLHRELRALQRKLNEVKSAAKDQKTAARAIEIPPIESFRVAAETMVEGKPLLDLQPNRYLDASRVASREAFDAVRKGDFEAAKAAKQKELINHFLFRESSKVKAEAESAYNYASKFSKASVRERIAQAGGEQGQHVYLDQIDNILEQFRFKQESNKQIQQRRQTLEQFAAQRQAQAAAEFAALNPNWATDHPGETPEIPQVVDTSIAGMSKNYRELNINELRAVRDALKNIETLAKHEGKILRDGHLISFAQEVADLERVARENNSSKAVPRSGAKLGAKERLIQSIHGLDAYMQKIEWLVDRLDGGDVNGPARRNIKKPIDDAWGESLKMGDEIFTKLKALIDARPKEDVAALEESTGIQFPKSDRPLNRRQLISWALNLGTEENQKVALVGEGLIELDGSVSPLVSQALGSLKKSELDFVQGVWDILEGMRPAIEAKALRTTGIKPKLKKVTPFDVRTADGAQVHLRGGYYPLKAEPGDRVGMKQIDPANLAAVGFQKPKTSTSHLQQVTGTTYRLLLDYENVLSKHLADVISDTTKGEAISQVYKFISNDQVRTTLQETLGDAESREFLTWLQDFAGNNKSGAGDASPFLNWLMARRSGMVVARLGGNLSSYLIQFGDVFKSIADPDMKTSYLAKAFLDIRRSPTKMIEEIRALSPNEMRYREKNFNRDIRDMLTSKGPFDQKKQIAAEFLMEGFAVMDRMITFPAWLGRFRQGMAEHGDQARAIQEADRAIARGYQAGDNRNMSRMMRQGGMTRLLTTFQGDSNTWYGIISAAVRSGNPRAISVGLMALIAEQVVGQYIRNRGPKDDQNKAGWVIEQTLLAGLSKIPVFGDVAQYGLSKLTGQYASLQNPTMQALEKTATAPGSIYSYTQGKKDEQEVLQDLTEATGIYIGIPGTSQAIRTWKYIHRVQTGKEPEPQNAYEAIRGAAQGSNKKR